MMADPQWRDYILPGPTGAFPDGFGLAIGSRLGQLALLSR